MLTNINSDIVINKKRVKYKNFLFYRLPWIVFTETVFVVIAFIGTAFDGIVFEITFAGTVFATSVTSSDLATEFSIILSNYLPFPQVYVLGFQV